MSQALARRSPVAHAVVISGTGLRNPITMLPELHSLSALRLGQSSLEFAFAAYASVVWALVWMLSLLWHLLVGAALKHSKENNI